MATVLNELLLVATALRGLSFAAIVLMELLLVVRTSIDCSSIDGTSTGDNTAEGTLIGDRRYGVALSVHYIEDFFLCDYNVKGTFVGGIV